MDCYHPVNPGVNRDVKLWFTFYPCFRIYDFRVTSGIDDVVRVSAISCILHVYYAYFVHIVKEFPDGCF